MNRLERLEKLLELEKSHPLIDNVHIEEIMTTMFNLRYELLAVVRAAKGTLGSQDTDQSELIEALAELEKE